MGNAIHEKLQAIAKRLIGKNGATMQLYKETTTGPSYDPVVTPITQDVIAVRSKYPASEVGDGSFIKSTDIKLLLSSEHDPRQYSKIIDGGNQYQIVDAQVIEPGETTILYKIQVRL